MVSIQDVGKLLHSLLTGTSAVYNLELARFEIVCTYGWTSLMTEKSAYSEDMLSL